MNSACPHPSPLPQAGEGTCALQAAFLLRKRLAHAGILVHALHEAREIVETREIDVLPLRPAQRDEKIRIDDRARADDPVPASKLRVDAFEHLAQRFARVRLRLLDDDGIFEIRGKAEQRLECGMHVRVHEREPAIDLGAAFRGAVAAELRFGKLVGEVVEDRAVLRQHPAVLLVDRNRAGGVELEEPRLLALFAWNFLDFVRLSDPGQDDVIGKRAGTGREVEFHRLYSCQVFRERARALRITARPRAACPGRSRVSHRAQRRRRRRRSDVPSTRRPRAARAARGSVPGRRRSRSCRPAAARVLPSMRMCRPASSMRSYSTPPSIATPFAFSVARCTQPVVLLSRLPGVPGVRCSSQTSRSGGFGRRACEAAARGERRVDAPFVRPARDVRARRWRRLREEFGDVEADAAGADDRDAPARPRVRRAAGRHSSAPSDARCPGIVRGARRDAAWRSRPRRSRRAASTARRARAEAQRRRRCSPMRCAK